MDQLDAMRLLVAVADTGSLSAAGRRLGLPLSTVSRQIAALEARLGARLLNRSTRRLSPTPSGVDYIAACRRVIEEVAEAERAAAREYEVPRGEVVVGAPLAFGRLHVLPVLIEVLAAYPEITVRLVQDDSVAQLFQARIDIAVRIAHLHDSSLVATRVGEIRRVVCASPAYLAARGTPQRPDDLAGHDCVVLDSLTSGGTWAFLDGGVEVAVPVRGRIHVNTAEAAVAAASAGLGLARVLSYQFDDAVQTERLRTVLRACEPPAWPVHLVHDGRARLPLKTRACLDALAERLRERIAGLATA